MERSGERCRSRGSPSRGLPASDAVPLRGRTACCMYGQAALTTAWHTPRWHRVGVACGVVKHSNSGDGDDSDVRQLRRAGAPMRTARPGAALGAPCPAAARAARRSHGSGAAACRLPEHAVCALIQPHRHGTGPSGADKSHPRPIPAAAAAICHPCQALSPRFMLHYTARPEAAARQRS